MVSIIIPVYNSELFISKTIQSAINQTYENIEIIIVDNDSKDGSWEIIKKFQEKDNRIKSFRNQTNEGPVRNWLRCVEMASGHYIKILWSDDLIAENFIEKTLPLFSEDVGFVFTGVTIFSNSNHLVENKNYFLKHTQRYRSSKYINNAIFTKNMPYSPGCAIFRSEDVRKNLLLQIPNKLGSDFSMHAIGSDLLLFLLTAKDYKFFGHVNENLSFFRSHKTSISVQSLSDGKLPLHYALAKSYFIENFYDEYKSSFAAEIQLLLWRYDDSHRYGMKAVQDFYFTNVKFNIFHLAKAIMLYLIDALRIILNKIS